MIVSPFFYIFVVMIKKLLFTALLCIIVQGAVAQNGNGLGGGIRAGLNLSDFTGSTGSSRAGISAGLFVDYTINRFGFEAGLYYSEQGSFGVAEQSIVGNRANYNLDYISLQLLVKYQIFNGFRVFLGPNAGYLINSKMSYGSVNQHIDYIAPWDIGIVGGVGYTFRFGLDVAASYTHGFIDLFKTERKSYTSMFKITVGWNFLNRNKKAIQENKKYGN